MYRTDTSARYGQLGPNANTGPEQVAPGVSLLSRRRVIWVETVRSRVDYSLAKRAALVSLFWGGATASDACDAHPYLLKAAKHHGEKTDQDCPVCRKEKLTHVTYTYGDALGEYSGRIKATRELEQMEQEIHEFTVYVVEVCQGCGWNHLTSSYVLGHGRPPVRAASRKSARVTGAARASTRSQQSGDGGEGSRAARN
jgi:hypothetical protein